MIHRTPLLVKFSLVLFLSAVITACSSSGQYYLLSTPSQTNEQHIAVSQSIGVEKITLPSYLNVKQLAVATGNRVNFLEQAVWAEDLSAGLTNRLVGFLQQAFNQPQVQAYPWHSEVAPKVRITVHISQFIAQTNKQGTAIHLRASWQIKPKDKAAINRLFDTVIVTSPEPDAIVEQMNEAFAKLEQSIAKAIQNLPTNDLVTTN